MKIRSPFMAALTFFFLASSAYAAIGVDKEIYKCVNGQGKKLKVRVSFTADRGEVVSQLVEDPKTGIRLLDYSVQIRKSETRKITLLENFNNDINSAIFSCTISK